jgi:hypothetical protein
MRLVFPTNLMLIRGVIEIRQFAFELNPFELGDGDVFFEFTPIPTRREATRRVEQGVKESQWLPLAFLDLIVDLLL